MLGIKQTDIDVSLDEAIKSIRKADYTRAIRLIESNRGQVFHNKKPDNFSKLLKEIIEGIQEYEYLLSKVEDSLTEISKRTFLVFNNKDAQKQMAQNAIEDTNAAKELADEIEAKIIRLGQMLQ